MTSKRAASWAERGAVLASVANPRPRKSPRNPRHKNENHPASENEERMAAAKNKSNAKNKKNKHNKKSANAARGRGNGRPRGPSPRGPKHPQRRRRPHCHAEAVASNPDALYPYEENPEAGWFRRGLTASALGGAAALAGLIGGFGISKAGLQSKWANAALYTVGGAAAGIGLGAIDRAAGIVAAGQFLTAAGQWALLHGPPVAVVIQHAPAAPAETARMPPAAPRRALPMHGVDALEGVVADTMGDAEEMGRYETLQGVVADTMGDAEEMGRYETLQGVVADTMGDAEEMGDAHEADALGDEGDVGEQEMF